MKNFVKAHHIVNQILMLKRTRQDLSFLIVEGRTDSLGYGWLVNKNKCKVISAHNKINVIKTIKKLDSMNSSGYIGIVDSDFWNLDKKTIINLNLVTTDTHDIETLVLSTPALEKVLTMVGDEDKYNSLEFVINKILDAGKPIGYLRWISQQKNLNLNFKGLDFGSFINIKTLEINIVDLIRAVLNNTKKCKVKEESLLRIIEFGVKESKHNPWQVCCGHDLVEILCLGLCEVFGSFSTSVKNNTVSRWLLLAYDSVHFSQSNLYKSIKDWEDRSTPFVVLSDKYNLRTPASVS